MENTPGDWIVVATTLALRDGVPVVICAKAHPAAAQTKTMINRASECRLLRRTCMKSPWLQGLSLTTAHDNGDEARRKQDKSGRLRNRRADGSRHRCRIL